MIANQNKTNNSEIYEISFSFNQISESEYGRIDSDDLWNDLWTNTDQYNEEVKSKNNGWSIEGIYYFRDIIPNPVLPSVIVVFGWFDLLQKTEIPTNNLSWIIVSDRVLKIIHDFQVSPKLHTIRVIERSQFNNVYSLNTREYENLSSISNLIYRDDFFYGIQLDEFQVLTDDSDITARPKKIQWRNLENKPPAFFTDPKSPALLVTREGRLALENANIKGIRFLEPFTLNPA
jgi:hypothetical protein